MVFRKRRRRRRRKSVHAKIKSVVKQEMGKVIETNKMVSYLAWSSIPQLIDSDTDATSKGLILSLTGGINPQNDQTVMNPGTYTDKQLFTLLPYGSQLTGTNNTQGAQQGGLQMQQTSGLDETSNAIGGIHCLEGRRALLKNWYASIILSNSPQQVADPRPCFVRFLVVQTRRPLASNSVAQQIFLQNHAVAAMGGAGAGVEPETVNSYINRDIVSKVYYDKLMKLTGPPANNTGGSSAQLKTFKIKVRLNKQCRWTYYYATRDPAETDESLTYMGPFIYAVFCGNQSNEDQWPKVAMNTMLTYSDC